MAKKKEKLWIPFTKCGNMVDWVRDIESHSKKKRNYNFIATMTIVGTERGRSAARFILRQDLDNGDDYRYIMFMSEVLNMMQKGKVIEGEVTGVWTFCKRGQNYSLRFVHDVSKETIEALHRGLEDAKAGRLVTSDDFIDELKSKIKDRNSL